MHSISIPIDEGFSKESHFDSDDYKSAYQESISSPDKFWQNVADRIDWIKPFTKVSDTSFTSPVAIKWFYDGTLNACVNCVDRHLPERRHKRAIIWEGNSPDEQKSITYGELHQHVCRFANVLKKHGVKKGDRVIIYMPMILEAAYAMLACARIGAVHSVVFGGFSPDSLRGRIEGCKANFVITADAGRRGDKVIPLKQNVDEALSSINHVKNVLVVKNTGEKTSWQEGRDLCYHTEIATVDDQCPAEEMNAEDPLFILYTSGSTGKPKGVLHTTGGYMVYANYTHYAVFDHKEADIYWCSADVGWVTGHSYVVYGPLSNGATTLMYEGLPTYPDFSRMWNIIDKHKVTTFYTAPTLVRALMREDDTHVTQTSRKSLRLIGSVGEPINPEAWEWLYHVVGEDRCPIVDTWWQTETGGIMISPLPGATPLKAGSASTPFFGVEPCLIDGDGNEIIGAGEGALAIKSSWPGQMRTVFGDHERFEETYFSTFKGYYFCGDGARRDQDGYYWITGRIDDVINVSGHRLGTAEIESALVAHDAVSEAAVVGYPHGIKGQGIYAFVTLKNHVEVTDVLKKELSNFVRKDIGPIATPDIIQWAPNMPKTRSGKIMRRLLRKIAAEEYDQLGDISTLADENVVQCLIERRQEMNLVT
jgi:acetyl-CoA synthetase